ncbi:serine/threonine-protein kinase HAL4/sat4 [Phlyctochytrium planicorne]|nr:serine/threonine-protein kinase HAL4/sat4 [Phlyctochytrium planicorne]
MQTFSTDIWTPGLESNSLSRKSGGSASRRPSTASVSSKGGSPKMEKKANGSSGGGFGPTMASVFGGSSSESRNSVSGASNGRNVQGSNSMVSSPKALRGSSSNLSASSGHLNAPNGNGSANGYSSGANSSDGGAGAGGKKHGILYKIFHPHDDGGPSILGRSRRSYNSGSESEMESEDEYASDASDIEGGQGHNHGLVMSFGKGSVSLPRGAKGSVEDLNGHGTGPRLMSMSAKKPNNNDADSASESESESQGGGIFRRDSSLGRSKGGNIFNKVLSRSRKTSVSGSSAPSPSGSDGNLSNASGDSESESDAEHSSHPVANKLFKNIMTSRRESNSTNGKSTTDVKKVAQSTQSSTSTSPSNSGSPSRKTSTASNIETANGAKQPENFMKPPLPVPAPVTTSQIIVPKELASDLLHPSSATSDKLPRSASETSLAEKYGKREEILGKGANAVVRLCCPLNSDKKYAIKEFRKRRKDETQKEYVKKLVAEFCISSTLDHPNVIKTVDLIQDEKKKWCVVMEYCAGGDLFARIHSGTLTDPEEINCYFKQLALGVKYLHGMGVAHRDLKPENLLLDTTGRTLKITDFGVSEVFRTPFCKNSTKAHGVCGSGPYIAPEEFVNKEYDSELVDVWAMGIIYYVMIFNSIPWRAAQTSDARYKHYTEHLGAFWALDRLPTGARAAMYKVLEPNPAKRMSMTKLFECEWFKNIEVCTEKNPDDCRHKHIRTPAEKH